MDRGLKYPVLWFLTKSFMEKFALKNTAQTSFEQELGRNWKLHKEWQEFGQNN